MYKNEWLKRAYSPVTGVYSETSLPPEDGLEGVGFSISNISDITMVVRFKHKQRADTVIRIPPLTACNEYLPVFCGVVIDNALQFFMHICEMNRGT